MDTSTPESISARARINNALRDGKIKKPSCCDGCGKHTSDIEAHHRSGAKNQDDIVWLCTTCHGRAHEGREKRLSDSPVNKPRQQQIRDTMRKATRKTLGAGE